MSAQLPLDCDWQSQLKTQDAFWFMQQNQVACDVVFEVGWSKDRVGAHSFVLMSRSTKFFHQYLTAKFNNLISIPEVTHITFKEFLRYLYTDICDYTNWQESLFLANQYEVKPLVEKIFDEKVAKAPPEEFCKLMKQLVDIHGYLEYLCFKYVFDNQKVVFECDTFYNLPYAFVREVVSSDHLVLEENLIYNALFLWAEKACHDQSMEGTGENKRKVLRQIIDHIRFPLLSQDFFSEHISEKGILEDADEIKILKRYLHPKKPVGPDFKFKTEPRRAPAAAFKYVPSEYERWRPKYEGYEESSLEVRRDDDAAMVGAVGGGDASASAGAADGTPVYVRQKEEPLTIPSNFSKELESDLWRMERFKERDIHRGWGYKKETVDAIAIVPSKDIAVVACSFYGVEAGKKMTGQVKIYKDNVEGWHQEFSFTCYKERRIYEIFFNKQVRFCANQEYHIILDIEEGLNGFYGKGGKSNMTIGTVDIKVKQSKYSTNSTDVNMGQIYGFMFKLFKPIPYKYGLNFPDNKK